MNRKTIGVLALIGASIIALTGCSAGSPEDQAKQLSVNLVTDGTQGKDTTSYLCAGGETGSYDAEVKDATLYNVTVTKVEKDNNDDGGDLNLSVGLDATLNGKTYHGSTVVVVKTSPKVCALSHDGFNWQ